MSEIANQGVLRAGVVGLGQIGGGVAICLARHKRPLSVYDIRPDAADKLEGVPPVLESPAAVARSSDVVMIAVLDGKQVRAVLEGPNGILAAAHPGLTIVVLSTITINELREFVALAKARGVPLLDCGVTNGQNSDKGEMISMIGGEQADVDRVLPVLDEFNTQVLHMGTSGAGMATKIARNLIHFSIWRAGIEGANLARAAGVDLDKFIELVDIAAKQPNTSPTIWMDPQRIVAGKRQGSSLEELARNTMMLQQKDLESARELAEQLGVNIAASEAARLNALETYRLKE